MNEDKLKKELEMYQELAKTDKNIDVASLMMNALEKSNSNFIPAKQKRWGYLISVAFPPFGLIFAVKFYFSGRDDAKTAAWICVILTAISIFSIVLLTKMLLSGSGVDTKQLEQISPKDLQNLVE